MENSENQQKKKRKRKQKQKRKQKRKRESQLCPTNQLVETNENKQMHWEKDVNVSKSLENLICSICQEINPPFCLWKECQHLCCVSCIQSMFSGILCDKSNWKPRWTKTANLEKRISSRKAMQIKDMTMFLLCPVCRCEILFHTVNQAHFLSDLFIVYNCGISTVASLFSQIDTTHLKGESVDQVKKFKSLSLKDCKHCSFSFAKCEIHEIARHMLDCPGLTYPCPYCEGNFHLIQDKKMYLCERLEASLFKHIRSTCSGGNIVCHKCSYTKSPSSQQVRNRKDHYRHLQLHWKQNKLVADLHKKLDCSSLEEGVNLMETFSKTNLEHQISDSKTQAQTQLELHTQEQEHDLSLLMSEVFGEIDYTTD
jgi:hypothetical protein